MRKKIIQIIKEINDQEQSQAQKLKEAIDVIYESVNNFLKCPCLPEIRISNIIMFIFQDLCQNIQDAFSKKNRIYDIMGPNSTQIRQLFRFVLNKIIQGYSEEVFKIFCGYEQGQLIRDKIVNETLGRLKNIQYPETETFNTFDFILSFQKDVPEILVIKGISIAMKLPISKSINAARIFDCLLFCSFENLHAYLFLIVFLFEKQTE